MVIKISKSSQIEAVVGYNMEKIEHEEAMLLDSWRIPICFDPAGIPYKQEIVDTLYDRARLNTRVKNSVTHISLNPDPKDPVSDALLTKMSKDLLDELGYGNQPYVIVKHEDIDRHHVHIVVSNVDENGKKIPDQFEKFRSNAIRRSLENKYRLHKAEEALPLERGQEKAQSVTDQVRTVARQLLEYRFGGSGEFRTLAEAAGLIVNEQEETGNWSYAVQGDSGQRCPAIPASELGEEFSRKAIDDRAATDQDDVQKHCYRKGLKHLLLSLQQGDCLADLNAAAKAAGLTILFRRTEQGRVYGCTIVDHKAKMVFNASKVDRTLAARNWQKFFTDETPSSGLVKVGRALTSFQKNDRKSVRKDVGTNVRKAGGKNVRNTVSPSGATTAVPFVPPSRDLIQSGGGKVHQEKANTHFRPEEEDEEEIRRKRKLTE